MRISDGEHDWVLRRPPLGHVVETAHDMGREYRVISALAGDRRARAARLRVLRRLRRQRRALLRDGARRRPDPPRPRPRWRSCRPTRRAGARSSSSTCSRGCTPSTTRPSGSASSAAPTASSSATSAAGASSGRRTRRVSCPRSTSSRAASPPRSPSPGPPAIVHGDYRLDNTMLGSRRPRAHRRGARLGDVDARRSAHRPRAAPRVLGRPRHEGACSAAQGVANVPGFISSDEVVARYAEHSGPRPRRTSTSTSCSAATSSR